VEVALGPRFVDLEVTASHFFSVKSGNGLCCLRVIGHFHEHKTASTACFPVSGNMNAPYQSIRLEQLLRSRAPRSETELLQAAKGAFQAISIADCKGFFFSAKYATSFMETL